MDRYAVSANCVRFVNDLTSFISAASIFFLSASDAPFSRVHHSRPTSVLHARVVTLLAPRTSR